MLVTMYAASTVILNNEFKFTKINKNQTTFFGSLIAVYPKLKNEFGIIILLIIEIILLY